MYTTMFGWSGSSSSRTSSSPPCRLPSPPKKRIPGIRYCGSNGGDRSIIDSRMLKYGKGRVHGEAKEGRVVSGLQENVGWDPENLLGETSSSLGMDIDGDIVHFYFCYHYIVRMVVVMVICAYRLGITRLVNLVIGALWYWHNHGCLRG